MSFLCVLHKNSYHLNIFFNHLLPFVQIIIFHLMSRREDVAWLAHVRELREMWCCPLPKGLRTFQGPHGLVYTGQTHRDGWENNEQTK